jgi:hypothetical protein
MKITLYKGDYSALKTATRAINTGKYLNGQGIK